LQREGHNFSGFHQGAGETAIAELLKIKPRKYSLVLIDEVETSLHPRVQRRLVRDLASLCRELELQIVLTTHSPYVLGELPPEARVYIMQGAGGRQVISGVSPEFAMTKMDEDQYPEIDVYVEDIGAAALLREILVATDRDVVSRVQISPYGAASVGRSLGQMADAKRFPRPTVVFLDGDQEPSAGCAVLPGGDAPERFVFEALAASNWSGIAARIGRSESEVIDACNSAMAGSDHHQWAKSAAKTLAVGSEILWQALCADWATSTMQKETIGRGITDLILDALPS
jgi:hypothetical protein